MTQLANPESAAGSLRNDISQNRSNLPCMIIATKVTRQIDTYRTMIDEVGLIKIARGFKSCGSVVCVIVEAGLPRQSLTGVHKPHFPSSMPGIFPVYLQSKIH